MKKVKQPFETEVDLSDQPFDVKVRAGFYDQEENQGWYFEDERVYILAHGVPKKYVSGVSRYAYDKGHSYGLEEILAVLNGVLEIFDVKEERE
jgi:hypothetical protein